VEKYMTEKEILHRLEVLRVLWIEHPDKRPILRMQGKLLRFALDELHKRAPQIRLSPDI